MMDMSGIAIKAWFTKWVVIIYSFLWSGNIAVFGSFTQIHCGFPVSQLRHQVPPMGLPGGWPGAPPFMPMPGVFSLAAMPWFDRTSVGLLLWGHVFFVWRHAYDAASLGWGFLVNKNNNNGVLVLFEPTI